LNNNCNKEAVNETDSEKKTVLGQNKTTQWVDKLLTIYVSQA